MPKTNDLPRIFALIAGVAFTLAGIGGFLPIITQPPAPNAPPLVLDSNHGLLLGLFPVNWVHSIYHLMVGLFGLFACRSHILALWFSRFLGLTLAALTIFGIIPQLHTLYGLMPLYGHDIWLHGLEAVIGLYLGFFARPEIPKSKTETAPHV